MVSAAAAATPAVAWVDWWHWDHLSVGEAYGQLGIIIGASTPWISEHWDEMGEGNL